MSTIHNWVIGSSPAATWFLWRTDFLWKQPIGPFSPPSIEKRWTKIKAYAVSVVEISRQIIQTTAREAGQAGAWFLLAGIENDSRTRAMLQWWRTQVGQEEDLSVERDRPGMTNHPHDAHPGPRAHRIYAEKLIPVLREKS